MMYFFLVFGFFLLIKGADFFVDGSSSAAKKLRVPPLIIGMTIVAMGTSLPETSVSVSASLAGKNDLSISNAVGSNIFNLMVVAGICSVLCVLPIEKAALKRDFPISIAAAAAMLGMGACFGRLNRFCGITLLIAFVAFLYLMVHSAFQAREASAGSEDEIKALPLPLCLIYMIGGIAAIALGGKMVVDGASDIASTFGMSDNLIGMTVVALGTSLPELVTSIVAARKNELDMALGNVIGSNIFNILFVLGIAASISPMNFTRLNCIDTTVLIACSALVFLFCLPKKKLVLWHGIVMLSVYSGYTVYLFMR